MPELEKGERGTLRNEDLFVHLFIEHLVYNRLGTVPGSSNIKMNTAQFFMELVIEWVINKQIAFKNYLTNLYEPSRGSAWKQDLNRLRKMLPTKDSLQLLLPIWN